MDEKELMSELEALQTENNELKDQISDLEKDMDYIKEENKNLREWVEDVQYYANKKI